MPLDLFDPSQFGFPEGSPIYDCDPQDRKAIIEARNRLRGSQVFSMFWQRVLTTDERNQLGSMDECFAADRIAPNHLARLRGWSGEHAIIEIAYRAGFLSQVDYEWLLERIGVGEASISRGQPATELDVPEWSRETGRLRYRGETCRLIRRVSQATTIVPILDFFQEQGWPEALAHPETNSVDPQWIYQVVKKLNENLDGISFSVQNESICWNRSAS